MNIDTIKKWGPHLFFLAYLLLCLFVAKHRIIYSDLAYYIFNLIEHETYYAPFGRHFGVFTQSLTLLGVKLHLPLKTLILLFSINIALIPYLSYLSIKYIVKSETFSWAPILLSSICVHHAFFHINAGIILGLNFAVIGLALMYRYVIEGQQLSVFQMLFGVLIVLIMLISHPLTIFTTVMFLGLLFAYEPKKILLTVSAILIALVIAKSFTFSSYEQGKMDLLNISLKEVPDIINNYATRFMVKVLTFKLYFISIITLANFVLLWKNKKILAFFAFAGLGIGYFFLTSIASFRYETFFAYVEEYYTSFLLISALFFVHLIFQSSLLPAYRSRIAVGLLVISFLGLLRIGLEPVYKQKTVFLEERMLQLEEEPNCSKGIILTEKKVLRNILVNWSVPYESLLISSLSGGEGKVLFFDGFNINKVDWEQNGIMVGAEWEKEIDITSLNPLYFNLSATPYCKINLEE